MSQGQKIVLGVLSLVPLFYVVAFFSFFAIFIQFVTENPLNSANAFQIIEIVHGLECLLTLGLMIYYVRHALQNKALVGDNRVLWVILLIILNPFTMPIYFYKFIWKK